MANASTCPTCGDPLPETEGDREATGTTCATCGARVVGHDRKLDAAWAESGAFLSVDDGETLSLEVSRATSNMVFAGVLATVVVTALTFGGWNLLTSDAADATRLFFGTLGLLMVGLAGILLYGTLVDLVSTTTVRIAGGYLVSETGPIPFYDEHDVAIADVTGVDYERESRGDHPSWVVQLETDDGRQLSFVEHVPEEVVAATIADYIRRHLDRTF